MFSLRVPQRLKLLLIGVAAAAAVWLGLLIVRALTLKTDFSVGALLSDLRREGVTYLYVAVATLAAALLAGWLVGAKAEELQKMSRTDPLTQLTNRRGFLLTLQDELQRSARYHTPLSVMILDIDYFKKVNDALGHEAGDAALRLVADSLRGTCRASDLAARYGGDEFVVIAPSTAAPEAYELANRIRVNLKRLVSVRPDVSNLSLSIGIADVSSTAGTYQGEALISAADVALYEAKDQGRDRACLAHGFPRHTRAVHAAVA